MAKRSAMSLRLLATSALAGLAALSTPTSARANPIGGQVTGGQASITSAGSTLTVQQTTSKAIIDWRSFDIAPSETTQFQQPSSSAIALNRINDVKPSDIEGTLTANGNIILLNPNGVLFGKGAQVDVSGITATSAGISNSAFMNESKLVFDQPGSSSAQVINQGRITAAQEGLVGLVAPSVENSGTITARLGKVQMVSGDTFTLDLAGDGVTEVGVSDAVMNQLVRNDGIIQANGGTVQITAAAARSAVDSLVVNTGVVQAQSVGEHNGKIILYAAGSHAVTDNVAANKTNNATSTVLNSGTLDASGYGAGETGGSITVTADHVALQSGSRVDASGDAGGGAVQIGGDFHGAGTTPTALATNVAPDAVINANAVTSGNGGSVAVWADDYTNFAGRISARGGALSGDGGFVETSGKQTLDMSGSVDASAPNGFGGIWLLDPNNAIINGSATSNPGYSTSWTAGAGGGNVLYSDIENSLNGGTSVTINASGSIEVAHSISKSAGGNATLDLEAGTDIAVDTGVAISSTVGKLNVTFDADTASGGGAITMASGSSISANGGNITFGGQGSPATAAAVGDAASPVGINLTSATLSASGGNIILRGTGYTAGSNVSSAYGIEINGSTIQTSGTGTIGLTGTGGGSGTGGGNYGIYLTGGGTVLAASGATTLTAIGGSGSDGSNYGFVTDTSGDKVGGGSTTGNITVNADTLSYSAGTFSTTGILTFTPITNSTTVGVGGATPTGVLAITNALLGGITASEIDFGATGDTGLLTAQAQTWGSKVKMISGSGGITIAGAQAMGAHDLVLQTDGTLAIGANLSGTGALVLAPASTGTTIGVNGGAGGLQITGADLAFIQSGFAGITIGGGTGYSGTINVTDYAWNAPITYANGSGAVNIANAGAMTVGKSTTTTGSGLLTLSSGGNIALNSAITATGSGGVTLNANGGLGTITAASNITTTGGAVTLNGPVSLGAVFTLNTGGGSVLFSSTVDGTQSFTVNAGNTGSATFTGAVGGTTGLGLFTVTAGGGIIGNSVTATGITEDASGGGGNISSNATGTLTPTNGIILKTNSGSIDTTNLTIAAGNNVTITSTSGPVTLGPITANNITVTAGTYLTQAAGSAMVSSAAGGITLKAAGGTVTSTGTLTLGGTLSFGTGGVTLFSGQDGSGNRPDEVFTSSNLIFQGGTTGAIAIKGFNNLTLSEAINSNGSIDLRSIYGNLSVQALTAGTDSNIWVQNNVTAGANITLNGPITTSGLGTVTVVAGNNLTQNAGATITSGAGGGLVLEAANGTATGTGVLTLGDTLSTGSGALTLISGNDGAGNRPSETFTGSNLIFQGATVGAVDIEGFNNLTVSEAINSTGSITLGNAAGNRYIYGNITTTALTAGNNSSIVIENNITSAANITLGGTISTSGTGSITIDAGNNLTQNAGATITSGATGGIALYAANNTPAATGLLTLGDNLSVGTGALTLVSGNDGAGNRPNETFTSSNLIFQGATVGAVTLYGFNNLTVAENVNSNGNIWMGNSGAQWIYGNITLSGLTAGPNSFIHIYNSITPAANITLNGPLTASGTGSVIINAGNNITQNTGAAITSGATGGITLQAANGAQGSTGLLTLNDDLSVGTGTLNLISGHDASGNRLDETFSSSNLIFQGPSVGQVVMYGFNNLTLSENMISNSSIDLRNTYGNISVQGLTAASNNNIWVQDNTAAAGAITLNGAISTAGTGSVTVIAKNNITQNVGAAITTGATGGLALEAAANLQGGTGLLTLNDSVSVGTGGLTLLSGKDTSNNRNDLSLGSSNLTFQGATVGAVSMTGFNNLTLSENIRSSSSITLNNNYGNISVAGLIAGNNQGITIANNSTATADIALDGALSTTGTGSVSITAGRNITQNTGATITTGATGGLVLQAAGNNQANTGLLTLNDSLSIGTGALTLNSGHDASNNRSDLNLSSSNLTFQGATVGQVVMNGFNNLTLSENIHSSSAIVLNFQYGNISLAGLIAGNNQGITIGNNSTATADITLNGALSTTGAGSVSITAGRNITQNTGASITSGATGGISLAAAGNNYFNTGLLTLNDDLSVGTGNLTLISGHDASNNRSDISLGSGTLTFQGATVGQVVMNGFNNLTLSENITSSSAIQLLANYGNMSLAGLTAGNNQTISIANNSTATADITLNGALLTTGSGSVSITAGRNLTQNVGAPVTSGATGGISLWAAGGGILNTGLLTLNDNLSIGTGALSLISGHDASNNRNDLTLNSSNLIFEGASVGAVTMQGFNNVTLSENVTSNSAISMNAGMMGNLTLGGLTAGANQSILINDNGNPNADITITGPIATSGTGSISIVSGRNLTQDAGATVTSGSGGGVTLQAGGGSFPNTGVLTLGDIVSTGSGALSLISGHDASSNRPNETFTSSNLIFQNTPSSVIMYGFNNLTLSENVASTSSIDLRFIYGDLSVQALTGGNNSSIWVQDNSATTGNLTLNGAVTASGSGSVTIVAGQNLAQNVGAPITSGAAGGLTVEAAGGNYTLTGLLTLGDNLSVGSGALNIISGTDGLGNHPNETFTGSNLTFQGATVGAVSVYGFNNLTLSEDINSSGAINMTANYGTLAVQNMVGVGINFSPVSAVIGGNGATRTLNAETGALTVRVINAGNNNLVLEGDTLSFSGNISGTGTLTLEPYTASKTIGIAGGAGAWKLPVATALTYIQPGFAGIIIGNTAESGLLTANAYTWNAPLSLVTGSGGISIAGAQTMGANNLTLQTDGALTLSDNLTSTGSGTLTLKPATASTSIGVNATSGSTLLITPTDFGFINSQGWGHVTIGSNADSGTMTLAGPSFASDGITTFSSGSGTISITGAMSGTGNTSFAFSGPTTLNFAGTDVTTANQNITFNNPVTVGVGTTINAGSGTTTFASTVNGAHALTVSDSGGAVIFDTAVGGATALASLTTTGSTTLDGNVTTTGAQTYNSAITLGGDDTLTTSNAAVVFGSTVDGAHALTLTASDSSASFNGQVGGITPLTALIANPTTVNIGSNITTAGNQSYGRKVVLTGNVTLNSDSGGAGGNIIFTNTVNGDGVAGRSLTLTSGNGIDAFGAAVGGTAAPTSISVTAGTIALSGSSIATTGNQSYNGAVTVGADTTLSSNGGSLSFGGTVDGAHALTLSSGTGGSVAFAGVVGGSTPLTNLSIASDGLTLGNSLFGTGTLTIAPYTASTAMHINDGSSSGLYLTGVEQSSIQSDWAAVVMGSASGTGSLSIGTSTWLSPLTLLNSSGDIDIAGAQGMGSNTFYANTTFGNLALASGASITSSAAGNAIVVASGGNFINNSGSSTPFTASSGRFVGYSYKQATDTNSVTDQQEITGFAYNALPPSSIGPGNGYSATQNTWVYDTATGSIDLTAFSQSTTYGTAPNLAAILGTTYNFSCSGPGCGSLALSNGNLIVTGLGTSASGNYDAGTGGLLGSGFTNNLAYTINYFPGTLTVSRKTLTVSGLTGSVAKTYDATTAATLAAGNYITNALSGDAVSVTNTAGSYNNANAGTGKNVSVSGLAIGGADAGNYTLVTGSISGAIGTITPEALTITAQTNSKTYDATTNAAATPVITGGALQGSDTASFSEIYANANAGSGKTLVASGHANDGNGGNNYSYTFVDDTSGVINQASLTLTAVANSKTYDGTASAAAAPTIAGLKGSDSISGLAEAYANANAGGGKTLSVSGYTINDGNGGGNYSVTTVDNTSGVITPATLSVRANNAQRRSNTANPTFGYSFSGFVGGQTFGTSGVAGSPILSTAATTSSPVGNYAITIAQGSLAGGNNYTLNLINGTLTVTSTNTLPNTGVEQQWSYAGFPVNLPGMYRPFYLPQVYTTNPPQLFDGILAMAEGNNQKDCRPHCKHTETARSARKPVLSPDADAEPLTPDTSAED